MSELVIRVSNRQRQIPVRALLRGRPIHRAVAEVLRAEQALRDRQMEVSVTLVGDRTMARLNRAYRGKQGPTDVLSFPLCGPDEPEPQGGPMLLGEVVISVPRALEQARRFGHSPQRELAYLAVHGCLHLLGYDHQDRASREAMRAREEAALGACGLNR